MVWFKVDDTYYAHPKVTACSPAARGLWVSAGSWSSAHLTDGVVPDHVLALLGGSVELADELVAAGLWRRTKGGYRFHEWHADADGTKRNPSREDVEADRASAKQRMRRIRAGQKANCSPEHRANIKRSSGEVTAQFGDPDPVPEVPNGTSSGPRKRGTRIPDDFKVTPEMVAWARERTPNVDGRLETEKFVNYWRAKTGKDATKIDWEATWRNWMLKAEEDAKSRRTTPASQARKVPPHQAWMLEV